ncbi:transmembrane protein 19 [Biomphalaria glabrata]|nr:transmembrane protein 19-like isoform X2 [Biomphalaria glabrata]XP_055861747.1 transmembrane protein 19-like isoform X2 [Biomphalaria glabrata]XP_055861752.1 transmembrane protein 19-like isoform X2 [Biomphalaria glabrata]XP_055861754.1 transmembrane protein 19-like isoform X2 [Biomphalaria glabrata]KAI8769141.1 transmembrane protein 19-like [Biomphalaria glabrata]
MASIWLWSTSILFPLCMVTYGLHKKSLNHSGAIAGIVVGFLLTISGLRFMVSLLVFFIFASKATKFKSARKRKFEAEFKEGGQRNWIQVVSNGGPAAVLAILYLLEVGSIDVPINFSKTYSASWYALSVMAALASSCGDTFSSEIGSAVGSSDPVHILKLKRVPRGTNGGVSLYGTFSSIIGGGIVGLGFYITELVIFSSDNLLDSPKQWPVVCYGALAGVIGSLIDSILGASLQYSGKHKKYGFIVEYKGPDVEDISGREILNNHSVNLLSSFITGIIIPYIAANSWFLF